MRIPLKSLSFLQVGDIIYYDGLYPDPLSEGVVLSSLEDTKEDYVIIKFKCDSRDSVWRVNRLKELINHSAEEEYDI